MLLQDKIRYPTTAHYILIYWLLILLSNIYIRYVPLISFPFFILSFSFIALEKSYQIGKKAPCQRFNYMIRYTASVFARGQYISYNYLTAFLHLFWLLISCVMVDLFLELNLCAPSAPAARFGARGALGAGVLNSDGNLSAVSVVFFVFGCLGCFSCPKLFSNCLRALHYCLGVLQIFA